ncbi:MAG TPA: hypothetical protein VMF86_17045 [Stellaceae bacterium]|nr:hypothetical protein [Stellaceae bacterium]
MDESKDVSQRPVATGLHPVIYRIIIGLCVWLVCSVWGFAGHGYIGLTLTVISLFVAAVVLIAVILSRILRRDPRRRSEMASGSRITQWLSGDFDARTGRLSGAQAAIEVLLPVAAVAFGMSFFALVLHLTVGA